MPFTQPGINPAPPAVQGGWAPHQINWAAPPPAPGWAPHAIDLDPLSVTRPPCVGEAEATAYFAYSHNNAAWQALTGDERTAALTMACRWLGTLCWDASLDCCDKDFINAWIMASSELALALHQNPTAIIGGAAAQAQQGTYVSMQKLGDLEQRFAAYPAGADVKTETGRVSEKAPIVLRKFPWLVDILGCWLETPYGLNRFVPLKRN